MDASKGTTRASFVEDGSGKERGRGGMRNEAKRRRNERMEGAGIDTDERRCTGCLAREGDCATMEKRTDVPCVGKDNDGEENPLGADGRAGRASPNKTRADAPQPKEVQVQDREHLSMVQENEAIPVQAERESIFNNGTRDRRVEDSFANGNPTQAGLRNIGQREIDMVFGQNPTENNRSPPIHFRGNPQVPHLATPPFESLPDARQQSIDGGGGVELTVPQKAPTAVPRRDSELETTGGIGTIRDDISIPAPGGILSSDRRTDQWPRAETDAQGLLNTTDSERENKCTSGPLEEYKLGEQALLSHPQTKGDGFLQTQNATLDSRRQDEGPLQGKPVGAAPQEETYREDAQENGKSKRKLGEAVNLKSKKSAKRGTKGKKAHEIKKKEQTVQLYGIGETESLEWSGPVRLSDAFKASTMTLSWDRLSVTSWKGYRTVLATHGVTAGTWYFEATPTHLGKEGHVRIGWATRHMEIQGPIGFDKYGYSYRDIDGSKVHSACRHEYGAGYKEGDVIGFLIHIPESANDQTTDRELVMWKGRTFAVDKKLPETKPMPGSFIAFTRNGEFQGIAFRNIFSGVYYPGASIFTSPEQGEGATVQFNFGPNFRHGPPSDEGIPQAHPMCKMTFSVEVAPKAEAEPITSQMAARNKIGDPSSNARPAVDSVHGAFQPEENGTARQA